MNFKQILNSWPRDLPLIMLGGGEGANYLALCADPISYEELKDQHLSTLLEPKEASDSQWIIGFLPYTFVPGRQEQSAPKIFRIHQLVAQTNLESPPNILGKRKPGAWLDIDSLELLRLNCAENVEESKTNFSLSEDKEWTPLESESSYLAKAKQVLEDIYNGTYYQLNLLRYFRLNQLSRAHIVNHWLKASGSYGSIFFDPRDGQEIISYSPERFVSISRIAKSLIAHTYPIKGTLRKCEQNILRSEEKLLRSEKDRAELSMIIDLMRNDLNRISEPHSVEVKDAHTFKSFGPVLHMYADICSRLREDLQVSEFFEALLPAGSITGAPKIEVMKHIKKYEVRERGYFMGNSFFIDRAQAKFDSSVMIRTIARSKGDQPYELAVGSGIVAKSVPEGEAEEIRLKMSFLGL